MTATRLILNGKKAGNPEIREAVGRLREAGHDLQVRVTWEGGDAARLVREAAGEGVPRLIAGGGDGSVHEAANGLMQLPEQTRPALGILPLGTANDFATACGIPTDDPEAALRLALEAEPVPVDLGRAEETYFVNVASVGFGAAVTAETPVELKNFLGGGAYTLMGLLKALDFKPYPGRLRTPEGEIEQSVIVGAVCNGRLAGGGQPLAPEALIDDGLFDVVVLGPFPLSDAAQVFDEIQNPSPDGRYARHLRVPWLEGRTEVPMPMNLDGEPASDADVRLEVVPRAIRMALPADCPCLARNAAPAS
jgi:lipid kinase YegS